MALSLLYTVKAAASPQFFVFFFLIFSRSPHTLHLSYYITAPKINCKSDKMKIKTRWSQVCEVVILSHLLLSKCSLIRNVFHARIVFIQLRN